MEWKGERKERMSRRMGSYNGNGNWQGMRERLGSSAVNLFYEIHFFKETLLEGLLCTCGIKFPTLALLL